MTLVSAEWLAAKKAQYGTSTSKTTGQVPASFVDFCTWIGVTLTPAQRVLAKIAYDGAEPIDLPPEEREIATKLFGSVDILPSIVRKIVVLVCGGRAGKSFTSSLRILHLALTHPCTTVARGEHARGLIICPDAALADQALRYIAGALESHPTLCTWVTQQSTDSITLLRPDGKVVEVVIRAASGKGKGGRGYSLVGALMDEAAFFFDANYVVCDTDIFEAVAPRIMPGGQLIIASTPWSEAGLLYEMFNTNFGTPVTAIAVHAPTLLMRPEMQDTVTVERIRDPQNCDREFDANFQQTGSAQFFDMAPINASKVTTIADHGPGHYYLGLDCAFRQDPTGGVIVRSHQGKVEIVKTIEIRPPKGGRLKPSQTIQQVLNEAAKYGCSELISDQHYIETVRECASGWTIIEAPKDNVEPYLATRTAFREARIALREDEHKLLGQLKAVQQKAKAGGGLAITQPRKGGAHGDLVSALVLAVWRAGAGGMVFRGKIPKLGSTLLERNLQGQVPDITPVAKVRWWSVDETGLTCGLRASLTSEGMLNLIVLEDYYRGRLSPAELEQEMARHAVLDGPDCRVGIWVAANPSGEAYLKRTRRVMGQLNVGVKTLEEKVRKESQSIPARLIHTKEIWCIGKADWEGFSSELDMFDPDKGSPVVDSLAGVCIDLARSKGSPWEGDEVRTTPKKVIGWEDRAEEEEYEIDDDNPWAY